MFLGYYGDRIKRSAGKDKEFDWFTSRFGGSTAALQATVLASLGPEDDAKLASIGQCECCKKPLALVAAIHAPQTLCPTQAPPTGLAAIAANSVLNPNYKPPQGEDNEELRVLLILACNEQRCWKLGRASWKSFRFHPHVVISEEELKRIKDEKAAAFRKTLQTPHYDNNEDETAKKTPINTPVKAVFATPAWASPFGGSSSFSSGGGFSSSGGFSSPSSSSQAPATPSSSAAGPVDLEALLKARDQTIEAKSPKPAAPATPSSSKPSTPSAGKEKTQDAPSISAATSEEVEEFRFEEAYIEFDKEPEIASYSGARDTATHEKKAGESLSEGTDGTWAGEGYESSVSAKDKPFHRFQKRLQRAPEQCLRYWRGAEPLYSSADVPRHVPSCSCGARRVAEVQLTPALIFMLKPTNPKLDSHLDFGTVIVYTCSANCISPKQPLHAEHIEIQRGM